MQDAPKMQDPAWLESHEGWKAFNDLTAGGDGCYSGVPLRLHGEVVATFCCTHVGIPGLEPSDEQKLAQLEHAKLFELALENVMVRMQASSP